MKKKKKHATFNINFSNKIVKYLSAIAIKHKTGWPLKKLRKTTETDK